MARYKAGELLLYAGNVVAVQEILPHKSWGDEPSEPAYIVAYAECEYLKLTEDRFIVDESQLSQLLATNGVVVREIEAELVLPLAKNDIVIYVITTTYEDFKVVQEQYVNSDISFLYVFSLESLLQKDLGPFIVVNMFRVEDVVLPEERLWVDGRTYKMVESVITDILTSLSQRGIVIFSDMEGAMYALKKGLGVS